MNKKCKHICKLCKHVIEDSAPFYTCEAHKREETNCVTGDKEMVYPLCSDMNKDGCCEKFELNKEVDARFKLIKVLKRRLENNQKIENSGRYDGHEETLEDILLENLIDSLENNTPNESRDFCRDYESDDYDSCYGDYFFYVKRSSQFRKKKGERE